LALECTSARFQPEMVPATVLAASGPRAIKVDTRQARRSPARVDTQRRLARFVDQPEGVAADAVHVRIDRSDGGCRADHGFDGVATFFQDAGRAFGGKVMRGDGNAAAVGRCHGTRRDEFSAECTG